MYARVLRKWSLHTKLQMSIIMWRLLLLTLLLLSLCASPATCIANSIISNTTSINNTNNNINSIRVSRSTAPASAIASASVSPATANALAISAAAQRANTMQVAAAAAAAAPAAIITTTTAQHPLSLPLSLSAAATPAAATVGDIIEESYYIPVDGDAADSNIYDSRLVQALDVGNVLLKGRRRSAGVAGSFGGSDKNSWRISNSYKSGSSSSRLFSSSSVVSNSNSNSNSAESGRQQEQLQHEQLGKQTSATFADNLAYAYYRRAAPATFKSPTTLRRGSSETATATAMTKAAAAKTTATLVPTTVFSPQFSVQHVANDENVAADDDDDVANEDDEMAAPAAEQEDEAEEEDVEEDEEEEEFTAHDAQIDVADGQASHVDVAGQQKVPNKKNSHIINLFKTYSPNNNYLNRNYKFNTQQQQQQQPVVVANSGSVQLHAANRPSSKARRHVTAEQRQHWLSQQQQQAPPRQQPQPPPHRSLLHPTPSSSASTPLPIAQYPTKKVFQLVNGKNLTRIVHLLPPTHYRIAAYEIPSSLPYRGELSEQQRRMLQHQREQQQLQLQMQQDQAARSRRDSRLFGMAQAMSGNGNNVGYYSMQQSPFATTLGQHTNAQQQQFQRLQQGNGASSGSSSWQQMSGNLFLRQQQPYQQQYQRQSQQQQQQHQQQHQQHLHKHQHSGGDGGSNHHRNAHNHKHNGNNNNNNRHNQRQRQRKRPRRYCSARDPAQLAFEAPIVFEGKITSMSPDRRHNFAATVQVLNAYKQQIGYQVKREQFVRLQFAYINSSGECDIYREQLRPRGQVRGDELELQRTYLFFVQQIDMRNFTILGQPIRKTRRVVEAVKDAVSENYAQLASIRTITTNRTMEIGKELHIVCKVQGRPPPKVTWFKDGKSINRNRKLYKFRHFKKRSELIIRSFNISDTGRYECRAKNKINQEPDRRTILIKADPEPRYPTSLTGGTGNVCPDDAAEFCLNGGTCNFFSEIGSYSCICPEGFMGERCDRKEVNNISPSTYSNEQECGDKKFYGSYYC